MSPSPREASPKLQQAMEECREKVKRIIRECNRTNEKFTDPDFDLRGSQWDTLLGLTWTSPTVRADPTDVEDALAS